MDPIRPDGPLRTTSAADLGELKALVMCSWLHQQQESKMWSNGGLGEGVLLKRAKDEYICCPEDLASERGGLFDAVLKLNVRVSEDPPFSCQMITYPPVCLDDEYASGQTVSQRTRR
jgi:hypothetical protein